MNSFTVAINFVFVLALLFVRPAVAGGDFGLGYLKPDESSLQNSDGLLFYFDLYGQKKSIWTVRYGGDISTSLVMPEYIDGATVEFSSIRLRVSGVLHWGRLYVGAGPLVSYWKTEISEPGCCGGPGITYFGYDGTSSTIAAHLNGINQSQNSSRAGSSVQLDGTSTGWHAFIGLQLFGIMHVELTHDRLPPIEEDDFDVSGTQIRLGFAVF